MSTTLIALLAVMVAAIQAAIYWAQYRVMRGQLDTLKTQVDELDDARRAKLYQLKLIVKSIYDECQDVPAPPETALADLARFDRACLLDLRSSTDTFLFKEVAGVTDLRSKLEELDLSSRDTAKDIHRLIAASRGEDSDQEVRAVGDQVQISYLLAGECARLLDKVV